MRVTVCPAKVRASPKVISETLIQTQVHQQRSMANVKAVVMVYRQGRMDSNGSICVSDKRNRKKTELNRSIYDIMSPWFGPKRIILTGP